uniref:Uncharacterized protein n=1 Tax=Anopheles quadriannulatus TaxID=34691 RepID=A0A182XSE0_ANOQN
MANPRRRTSKRKMKDDETKLKQLKNVIENRI